MAAWARPGLRTRTWYSPVKPVSKPLRAARRYSRHTRTRSGPPRRSASARLESNRSAQCLSVSA